MLITRQIVSKLWRKPVTRCIFCMKNRQQSTDSSNSTTINMAHNSSENLLPVEVNPDLQPLIILHGMMGSKTNWQSLVKVFAKHGRKVIAVDHRNHGDSAHTEHMDYFLMRDDLLRLMDEQKIEQAVLLGHSMGGKTCMTTALTKPDRVSGLIVEDVAPMESPSHGHIPVFMETMLKINVAFSQLPQPLSLSNARKVALDRLEESVPNKATRHFLASNLMEKDEKIVWRVNLDSIINNFPTLVSFPKFEHSAYQGSTLFVGGSSSPYIQEKDYPLILSLFPLADIQHIDKAGHWVHSEKPREFVNIVNEFLDNSGL